MNEVLDNVGERKRFLDLIYLAGCAVNEIQPDRKRIGTMDIDAVLHEADRHMLGAAAAFALESAGFHDARTSFVIASAMRKAAVFDRERKIILDKLEEAGVWYLPLKGIVIKDLYPKFGMREMCDNDILYDKERRADVKKIMLGLGFSEGEEGSGIHDMYVKPPFLNFEMHWALFTRSLDPAVADYYENVESCLIKDNNGGYGRHFSPEDLYIFVIVHAYKHYSLAGTGLRTLLDIYLLLKKTAPDLSAVSSELEKIGLADFEKRARMLASGLFSGSELTDDAGQMLEYIMDSGAYGTIENRVGNFIQKSGGGKTGKRRYIWNRLFPSMEQIKEGNSFFYRHKFLLPLLLPYRIGRGVLKRRKRLLAELRTLIKKENAG